MTDYDHEFPPDPPTKYTTGGDPDQTFNSERPDPAPPEEDVPDFPLNVAEEIKEAYRRAAHTEGAVCRCGTPRAPEDHDGPKAHAADCPIRMAHTEEGPHTGRMDLHDELDERFPFIEDFKRFCAHTEAQPDNASQGSTVSGGERPEQVEAQPDAWRWRQYLTPLTVHPYWGDWQPQNTEPQFDGNAVVEVQPLYTSPPKVTEEMVERTPDG